MRFLNLIIDIFDQDGMSQSVLKLCSSSSPRVPLLEMTGSLEKEAVARKAHISGRASPVAGFQYFVRHSRPLISWRKMSSFWGRSKADREFFRWEDTAAAADVLGRVETVRLYFDRRAWVGNGWSAFDIVVISQHAALAAPLWMSPIPWPVSSWFLWIFSRMT